MRAAAILLLLTSAGCAAGGDWPSLSRRPAETAPLPMAETVDSAPATAPAANIQPVVAGRLAEATRDFAATETRWRTQRAASDAAAAAAKGAASGSPAAAKAELERSRLDRIVAQIGDLRARLDGIAGDLALAAANGGDAGSALKDTGALIAKVEALKVEAAK